jgi:succinate-acetate transporter protein
MDICNPIPLGLIEFTMKLTLMELILEEKLNITFLWEILTLEDGVDLKMTDLVLELYL